MCIQANKDAQMQTQARKYISYILKHMRVKTQSGQIKRQTWPNYFLLFLPLSACFSNTPIAFNLAFILPHSQYHPQSVSTLQHSPCVSHLSLSQLLALFPPLSDTQTVKQKAKFLEIKSSQQKAEDVISNISCSLPPHEQQQRNCLVYAVAFLHSGTDSPFTYALLYMRVHIIFSS